jgi:hypothetical protein
VANSPVGLSSMELDFKFMNANFDAVLNSVEQAGLMIEDFN